MGWCTTSHSMAEAGSMLRHREHKQIHIVQPHFMEKLHGRGQKRNSSVQNFSSLALFRCFNTLIVGASTLDKFWSALHVQFQPFLMAKLGCCVCTQNPCTEASVLCSLLSSEISVLEAPVFKPPVLTTVFKASVLTTLQLGLDKFRSATSF